MVVDVADPMKVTDARADARLVSIDVPRGSIMALMALDHARAFIVSFAPDPTDIDSTAVPLFATRWITHLCAPGFLLLAGAAARLQLDRRNPGSLAFFRATCGGLLLVKRHQELDPLRD